MCDKQTRLARIIARDNLTQEEALLRINAGKDDDFYIKQGDRKKAYIREPYGWTYKINHNKQFTFENICNLIDSNVEGVSKEEMKEI